MCRASRTKHVSQHTRKRFFGKPPSQIATSLKGWSCGRSDKHAVMLAQERDRFSRGAVVPCREWGSCPWLSELDGRPHRAHLLVCPALSTSILVTHVCALFSELFLLLLTFSLYKLTAWPHHSQDGTCNTAVGARRVVNIGEQRMFERLTAVDDDEHIL